MITYLVEKVNFSDVLNKNIPILYKKNRYVKKKK